MRRAGLSASEGKHPMLASSLQAMYAALFTGWISFLSPSQQCRRSKGKAYLVSGVRKMWETLQVAGTLPHTSLREQHCRILSEPLMGRGKKQPVPKNYRVVKATPQWCKLQVISSRLSRSALTYDRQTTASLPGWLRYLSNLIFSESAARK